MSSLHNVALFLADSRASLAAVTFCLRALVPALHSSACCRGITCQAYAFAPPACAAKHLAAGCRDYVTSVAVADDIITRFSPGALARLHGSLADMSPEEIHEVRRKHAT